MVSSDGADICNVKKVEFFLFYGVIFVCCLRNLPNPRSGMYYPVAEAYLYGARRR